MRILLLGKTGFIGRNLNEFLRERKEFYSCIIEAPSSFELDALSESAVYSILKSGSFDVVLNCLDRRMSPDAEYAEQRLRMYYNLANHSDLFGKMIYFGTGAEYCRQKPIIAIKEKDFGRQIPLDSYGFAMFQMATHALQSKNIYNFRLFGIFGPYEDWQKRFISNCICKAICSYPLTIRQDRVMDYLYIEDLCKIVTWAMSSDLTYHAYNASSSRQYKLTELAREVSRQAQQELPVYVAKEGLADEYTASNELLVTEMQNFHAEPIADSISKLFDYYAANITNINKESLLYQ